MIFFRFYASYACFCAHMDRDCIVPSRKGTKYSCTFLHVPSVLVLPFVKLCGDPATRKRKLTRNVSFATKVSIPKQLIAGECFILLSHVYSILRLCIPPSTPQSISVGIWNCSQLSKTMAEAPKETSEVELMLSKYEEIEGFNKMRAVFEFIKKNQSQSIDLLKKHSQKLMAISYGPNRILTVSQCPHAKRIFSPSTPTPQHFYALGLALWRADLCRGRLVLTHPVPHTPTRVRNNLLSDRCTTNTNTNPPPTPIPSPTNSTPNHSPFALPYSHPHSPHPSPNELEGTEQFVV